MNNSKHIKALRTDNKGYSLVEMIIVIAIITIMAVAGFTTMAMVYSAKAQSAGNNLNAQISTLTTLTKAQNADLAMQVYFSSSDNRYYVCYGTYSGGTFTKDTTRAEVSLTKCGKIYYTAEGSASESEITSSGVTIKMNKSDGSVIAGAGDYRVTKQNGKTALTVTLNKNTGSHYIN